MSIDGVHGIPDPSVLRNGVILCQVTRYRLEPGELTLEADFNLIQGMKYTARHVCSNACYRILPGLRFLMLLSDENLSPYILSPMSLWLFLGLMRSIRYAGCVADLWVMAC